MLDHWTSVELDHPMDQLTPGPIRARLLSVHDAAAYCGVTVRTFKAHVPLPPVKIGSTELWGRNALDAYIDGLQGSRPTAKPVDWAERATVFVAATQTKFRTKRHQRLMEQR